MKRLLSILITLCLLLNIIPRVEVQAAAGKNVRELALGFWSDYYLPSIKSLVGDYIKYYDDGTYSGYLYIDLDQEITINVSDSRNSWTEKHILSNIWEKARGSFGYQTGGYLATPIYYSGTVYEGGPDSKYISQLALEGYSNSATGNAKIPPLKNLIATDSVYYNDGEYQGYLTIDFAKSIKVFYTWSTSGSNGNDSVDMTIGQLWNSGATSDYYASSTISVGPIYYTGTVERLVDVTPPTISISKSINTKTNGNIVLTAIAVDDVALHAQAYDWGSGWSSNKKLTVSDNGTYTVKARDAANNTASKSIVVDNIDKIPPTFFASTMPTTDRNKGIVSVVGQDNSMEALEYSFNSGATWQDSNMFEAPLNQPITIKVRDKAGNIATTDFIPTLSGNGGNGDNNSQNITVPITIFGDAEIEGTIYGKDGILRNSTYKTYSSITHMPEAVTARKTTGIAIKLEAEITTPDRYLSGNVRLNNKDYPIKWGSFTGDSVVATGKHTGYVYVDKDDFTSNLKNAKMRITVGEYLDRLCKTKVAEGEKNISVSLDISPPALNAVHNKFDNTVVITAFDSVSGVKNILYRIDGGVYKTYSAPFTVLASNNTIEAVAVDKLENSSRTTLTLRQNDTPTNIASNIYTYKTQNSVVHIIGGKKSNTTAISLNDLKIS